MTDNLETEVGADKATTPDLAEAVAVELAGRASPDEPKPEVDHPPPMTRREEFRSRLACMQEQTKDAKLVCSQCGVHAACTCNVICVSKIDYARRVVGMIENTTKSCAVLASNHPNISEDTFLRARAERHPPQIAEVGAENETPETSRRPGNVLSKNNKIYPRSSAQRARATVEVEQKEAEERYNRVLKGLKKLGTGCGMEETQINDLLARIAAYMTSLPLMAIRRVPKGPSIISELRAAVAKLDEDRAALDAEREDFKAAADEATIQLEADWAEVDAKHAELAKWEEHLKSITDQLQPA